MTGFYFKRMDLYFIFKVVQPFLQDKINLHDSCGVNNLHGIPGILGGLLRLETNYSFQSNIQKAIINDAEGRKFDV